MQNRWPEPAWIAELPKEERDKAKVRFHLSLAAVYAGDSAKLTDFSRSLGLSGAHLNVCRQRGKVSPEIAVKIESALGRDNFPRELFNDIFSVAD